MAHRLDHPGHDDHHLSTRRQFLRQLGLLSAGTALLPGSSLKALGSTALTQALLDSPGDRILVLIRLKGGNDGLNTIVPVYNYDLYRQARPRLGLRENQLLSLTSELSVSQDFSGAHTMWNQGAMKVVNGVGYPDPNLSHFRGTDILTSASNAQEILTSGWLGRHLDNCFPDFLTNPPDSPPAIQIGGAGSLTFTNDENVSLAVTVSRVEELVELAERGELYPTTDLPDCLYGEQLGYLRSVANSTFIYARVIEEAHNRGSNSGNYLPGQLGAQLAQVARLIKGGLGTRVYLVTLEGFDTHASQENYHPELLRQLGSNVQAFFEDLTAGQQENRVLAFTFSEFGRRIEENASAGTDHGTAAPFMIFGPALNGNGAIGGLPQLNNPDNDGNLRFSTDFRSLYATLLEHWLCLNPMAVDEVLGGQSFARLDLGFDCSSVSTRQPRKSEQLQAAVHMGATGWYLMFEARRSGLHELEWIDVSGRVLHRSKEMFGTGQMASMSLTSSGQPMVNGVYAWRLRDPGGATASGLLPVLR